MSGVYAPLQSGRGPERDLRGPDQSGRDQGNRDYVRLSPEMLADKARTCKSLGSIGVAFTYNEPLVGWEYVRDTAKLVKEAGMVNVLVTNGTAFPEVLEELLPYMDAMNIDLKGFTREYYRKLGGDLEMVKEFIVQAAALCHVELTTLIVPGENDELDVMVLGRKCRIHFSAVCRGI